MDNFNVKTHTISDFELQICESKKYGLAGQIWDTAFLFSNFLCSTSSRNKLKNKIILEIGAGTGLCGLVAALCGAKKVYLTDREDALPVIQANIETNKEMLKSSTKCEIIVQAINWNNKYDFNKIKDRIDIIIASEIIYHGCNYANILLTFDYFADKDCDILLAFQSRIESTNLFFNLLEDQKDNNGNKKWATKVLSDEYLVQNDIELIDGSSIILIKNLSK